MTENSKPAQPWLQSYPAGIDYNAPIPAQTMVEMFDEAVAKYGDRTCINFMDKKHTYKEVSEMVDRFAKGLQDQGIGKGSTVGVCLPNTPFYIIAYYGAMKAGAKVANFDPTSPPEALATQIKDSKTDVMVAINVTGTTKQPIYANVEKALELSPLKKIIVCDIADALPSLAKRFMFRAINRLCDITERMAQFDIIIKTSKDKQIGLVSPLTGAFNKAAQKIRQSNGIKPVAKVRRDSKHIFFSDLLKSKGPVSAASINLDDAALLQYTGGTTGVPKGASLTHKNLTSNVMQTRRWFTGDAMPDAHEKVITVLPFFHVFSMTTMMNLSIAMGSEIILLPEVNIEKMLDLISREKATVLAGVPSIYQRVCTLLEQANEEAEEERKLQEEKQNRLPEGKRKPVTVEKKYDISSLKLCISGGAPMPETTMAAFKALTSVKDQAGVETRAGIEIVEGYGLSETAPLIVANPVNGKKIPGSIGFPVPGTEIKFTAIDDREKTLPYGEEGEICVRGPQVMPEYFGRPDATKEVFDSEGFFHTGDVGIMAPDGSISITDRIKDMIIVNGMKAFPKKIEEVIRKFPGVADAMVVGIADEKSGEAVKVILLPKNGAKIDNDALVKFLKDHLKIYELPYAKNIESWSELPLTKIGKPDKKAVKEVLKARGPKA